MSVEWLIDTGADIGVVRKAVGDQFDLIATGASASPTTGGGGILVRTGLQAEFEAEDRSGVHHKLRVSEPVAVKSNNSSSDILGMDQLAAVAVEVTWNPAAQTGTLRINSAQPSSSTTSPPAGSVSKRPNPPPVIVDHGTWVDIGGVRIEKRLWKND